MGVDCDGPIAVLMRRGRARRRGDPQGAAPGGLEAVPGALDAGALTAGAGDAGAAWDGAFRSLSDEAARWQRALAAFLARRADSGERDVGAVEALLAARDDIELLAWELSHAIARDDRARRIRLGRLRVALAALDEEMLAHPKAFVVAAPLLARERTDFRLSATDRDRFWWWYEIPAWAADPAALQAACRSAVSQRMLASEGAGRSVWREGPKGGPVDGPKGGARPGA